ncbi:hypothetical protein QBC33DRAFT_611034 [Phialemonium atrogriseum]|uniref:Uncharacterized protein n=1 Tax=Phialemonium atrogriseum TaxID=1093897 RepID=A0AAJ0BZU2_9PEZI|nr:uncharacterized protein QBC33DRAFT_611034 [Phialemonium atrogriseum]KAK1767335.1 hypothetical protein QBC33DRAFT_611034 [Phialemonium atrogriseum]
MASTTNTAPGATQAPGPAAYHDPRTFSYENSNIEEITVRQLNEDTLAYRHDLDFCREQLAQKDLTPQETRALQLRVLDLGHQIRHCQHRVEILQAQMRARNRSGWPNPAAASAYGPTAVSTPYRCRTSNKRPAGGGPGITPAPSKRAEGHLLPSPADHEADGSGDSDNDSDAGATITALQRLGHWRCRLCRADKYLHAGIGRVPAAPCKWPLKDVAKMIAHFTEMHAEHLPAERCAELGAALRRNRGPFEYWLRQSRSQDVGADGAVVSHCVDELLAGRLPDLLRRLSRAAAGFPTG